MDAGEDHFKSNRPLVLLKPQDRDALISKTKKNRNKTADGSSKPGVVYLGRIPHGFYEKEMRAYFSQFGDVTRLRLSRNKKTGKSKHYAFIEFTSEETAKIVAETMNDYLMFNHLLKCKFVPQEKVHPDTFNGANKKFKVIPWQKVQRERHNKPKSEEQHNKLVQNLIKKEKSKKRRLEELGIEYEFAGYEALVESDGKGSNVDGESTKKSTEATKAKKEASTVEKPSVSEPKSAKAKPATVKSVSEKSVAPKPKKAKTEQAVKPSATAVETRKRTESANDKVVAKTGETKKGKAAGGSTKANGTDATPKGKSTATKAGKPTRKRNVRDV
ncbi:hypothetical protein BC832DRAFT_543703 [Gaertneriomyces semiglobifer]|nr:hypothetical protein BC832DRAFT_543703 [Gaertneriomyces semiglobifer]